MEKDAIDEIQSLRAALRNAEAELQRVRDEGESRRDLVDILHEVMGDRPTAEIFHFPYVVLHVPAVCHTHQSSRPTATRKRVSSPRHSSSPICMIWRSSSTGIRKSLLR